MRKLLFLFLAVFMTACATIPPQSKPALHCPSGIRPSTQWYNSGHIFRLRHGGVLKFTGKTVPMTGFMILDTAAMEAAVTLLTGLGIKLATLKVTNTDSTVLYASPMARSIPHFLDQCALSIRQMFLVSLPDTPECCMGNDTYTLTGQHGEGTLRASFATDTEQLTRIESGSRTIRYEGINALHGVPFPRKITLTDQGKAYTITLQLTHGKIE